jgi:hypothetical protein
MHMQEPHPTAEEAPLDSQILGYGPMVPFAAAAIGAAALPAPWPTIATSLAIIWGSLILAFIGGVRRGFGFGASGSSTSSAIIASVAYFVPAGLAAVALALQMASTALLLLAIGFYLVLILDRDAARKGNAPPYFAWLRVRQMLIAIASLLTLLALQWLAKRHGA